MSVGHLQTLNCNTIFWMVCVSQLDKHSLAWEFKADDHALKQNSVVKAQTCQVLLCIPLTTGYIHVSTYYYTIAITLLIELGNLSKFYPIQKSLDKINFRKIVVNAKILIMWSFSLFSMSLSTFRLGTEFRSDWSIHTCIRHRGLHPRARDAPMPFIGKSPSLEKNKAGKSS